MHAHGGLRRGHSRQVARELGQCDRGYRRGVAAALLGTAALLGSVLPAAACTPYVEQQAKATGAVLRPHHSALEACKVSEESYRRVLAEWLQTRDAATPPPDSLALGRAVEYPWISRYLADAAMHSAAWRYGRVRATPGRHNAFVAALLSESTLLQRLDRPFVGSALQVRGVAVEKVLLGPASEYASVSGASARLKVPFDAQLWLVLGPRAQDSGLTQAIDDAQTRGAPGGDEAAEQAHQ